MRNQNAALFFVMVLIGIINVTAFAFVFDANRTAVIRNCHANDNQNRILVKLIDESLAPTESPAAYAKLTSQQQHAVQVFKEQRQKLTVPTCADR